MRMLLRIAGARLAPLVARSVGKARRRLPNTSGPGDRIRMVRFGPVLAGRGGLFDSRDGWYISRMTFTIELEREDDGRWLAEVPALSGVMCYGADRDEAMARVQALALRVIADRLEHREAPAEFLNVTFQAA
jgi:predicted RNase H-like HicB family nuclease